MKKQQQGSILIILVVVILAAAIVATAYFVESQRSNTKTASTSSTTTTTTKSSATTGSTYTDSENGYSFDPGSSMQAEKSPFILSGTPIPGVYVLIAKAQVAVTNSDASTIQSALQSVKMRSYAGADPNPVELTSGQLDGYVINYKFADSTGEQNEVWQFGFYTPKSNSVSVISLIGPYYDSPTSDKFLKYAYQVFESVKIDQ